jgi:hypothetical protein
VSWTLHKPGLYRWYTEGNSFRAQQWGDQGFYRVRFERINAHGHVRYVGEIEGKHRAALRRLAEKFLVVLADSSGVPPTPARDPLRRREWHSAHIFVHDGGGFTFRATERALAADGAPAGAFLSVEMTRYDPNLPSALRAFADEIERLNAQDHIYETT